ncbi:hypothetical protein [Cystobacter fuscus]
MTCASPRPGERAQVVGAGLLALAAGSRIEERHLSLPAEPSAAG